MVIIVTNKLIVIASKSFEYIRGVTNHTHTSTSSYFNVSSEKLQEDNILK